METICKVSQAAYRTMFAMLGRFEDRTQANTFQLCENFISQEEVQFPLLTFINTMFDCSETAEDKVILRKELVGAGFHKVVDQIQSDFKKKTDLTRLEEK